MYGRRQCACSPVTQKTGGIGDLTSTSRDFRLTYSHEGCLRPPGIKDLYSGSGDTAVASRHQSGHHQHQHQHQNRSHSLTLFSLLPSCRLKIVRILWLCRDDQRVRFVRFHPLGLSNLPRHITAATAALLLIVFDPAGFTFGFGRCAARHGKTGYEHRDAHHPQHSSVLHTQHNTTRRSGALIKNW